MTQSLRCYANAKLQVKLFRISSIKIPKCVIFMYNILRAKPNCSLWVYEHLQVYCTDYNEGTATAALKNLIIMNRY